MIKVLMEERDTLTITNTTMTNWYKIGKVTGAIEALQWVAYDFKEDLEI